MGNCDVCNGYTSWEEGTAYTADEFRRIVRMGFEPPATVTMLGPAAVQGWKTGLVENSTTGWLLCPSCARRAGRYLPKTSGSGPAGHVLYETMATATMLGVASEATALQEPVALDTADAKIGDKTADGRGSMQMAAETAVVIRSETKACPACKEEIAAEATSCPACQAGFEVSYQGYCATERAVMECDGQGRCSKCGKDVLDKAVVSRVLGEGERSSATLRMTGEEGNSMAAPIAATVLTNNDETKKCPQCGETIKLEARVCRFCQARFEVSEQGYCPSCHKLVEPDGQGKCPDCRGELVDRRVSSRLVDAAFTGAAVAGTADGAAIAKNGTPFEATNDLYSESEVRTGTEPPGLGQGRPIRWWELYLSPNGRIGRFSFFVKGILPVMGVNVLIITVLSLAVAPTSSTQSGQPFPDALMPVFAFLVMLTFWAWLMLIVKRFHDLNRSGWNILLWIIPFVGQFIYLFNLIECFFVKGKSFATRFGPATDRATRRA